MSDSPTVIHVVARAGIPNQVDVPTPGPPGPVGAKWQVGTVTPVASLGGIGDYYLRSNGDVYGPKTSDGWGTVIFTLRQPVSTDLPQPLGASASAGSSPVPSASDHRHPLPTAQQVGADSSGTAAAAIAAHLQAKDHLTPQQAAAAAPVQSVAIAVPVGWSATPANQSGNITITLALPVGSSLVSSSDRSTWNMASTERLRWDGGSAGLDPVAGRQSLGLHPVAASGLYSALGGLPDLTIYATSTAVSSALSSKADLVGGVIPSSQIPAIAITQYLGSVNSQSAMLALSGERGDWCLRTDSPNNGQWILSGDNPALIGSWVQIPIPIVPVQSINGQTGAVTLGPTDVGAAPSVHGHVIEGITGLATALAGKANTLHNHQISDVTGLQAVLDGKTTRRQAIAYAIALGGFP